MASSSSSASPDTIINLKVSLDGTLKKVKLPLRDLGAGTLATKVLQESLQLPSNTIYLIERYSDSAASYVVLDPANPAVFKQLYRAAKAKQKLKLRITSIPKEKKFETAKQPAARATPTRQVTVEDVPEATSRLPAVKPASDEKPPKLTWEEEIRECRTLVESIKQSIQNRDQGNSPAPVTKTPVDTLRGASPKIKTSLEEAMIANSDNDKFGEGLGLKDSAKPGITVGAPQAFAHPRMPFAVYCNSCDKTIPDVHYHCSTCDDGDFDLCQACIDVGITCHGEGHWLIKRMIRDGAIVTSTTERKAPKPAAAAATTTVETSAQTAKTLLPQGMLGLQVPQDDFTPVPVHIRATPAQRPISIPCQAPPQRPLPLGRTYLYQNARTCNNCVHELPDAEFLHCTNCPDFDLCKSCFVKGTHGHHPRHGFLPAVDGHPLDSEITTRLAPGRNEKHNALCDGCDMYIKGVRYKCLDCPDWDFCSLCVVNANFIHPDHRFVPIYEPLPNINIRAANLPVHFGIHCDGPLCQKGSKHYIVGDRYKCAVCHDTDFCANCEASPASTHNKTHPLIKFKTPVRNVNVTTTGEHENGTRLPQMGDRPHHCVSSSASVKSTKVVIAPTAVRTVVNVQPKSPPTESEVVPPVKTEDKPVEHCAVYVSDTIADGTVMEPNHIFEQTWTLRNAGKHAWPQGCRLKYIGGDYMGHIDSNRPAAVPELISASESTVCYAPLAPGQEFSFTVLLRTPPRDGKVISYWRLMAPDGLKFGHRLWCDVDVKSSAPIEETKSVAIKDEVTEDEKKVVEEEVKAEEEIKAEGSKMIFPKLEKESPVASIHQESSATASSVPSAPSEISDKADEFEDCNEDEDWSEEGFMTDEEYDILDASDEEYTVEENKHARK